MVWADIFLTCFSLSENSSKTHFCPKTNETVSLYCVSSSGLTLRITQILGYLSIDFLGGKTNVFTFLSFFQIFLSIIMIILLPPIKGQYC